MGYELVSLVFSTDIKTGPKFVLVALADRMGPDRKCWAFKSDLLRRCSLEERSLQRHLSDLVALGVLHIERGAGPKGCNVFQLLPKIDDLVRGDSLEGGDNLGGCQFGGVSDSGGVNLEGGDNLAGCQIGGVSDLQDAPPQIVATPPTNLSPITEDNKTITEDSLSSDDDGDEAGAEIGPVVDLPKASPVSQAFDLWNVVAARVGWPQVQNRTEARAGHLRKRLREIGGIDGWVALLEKSEASDYLTGRNGRWDRFAFDWVIKQANMTKVFEGNYDNKPTRGPTGNDGGMAGRPRPSGNGSRASLASALAAKRRGQGAD